MGNDTSVWQGKRYWIVGASEGLGRALAQTLSGGGAELILSARNGERLAALASELPGSSKCVPCDLTDADSMADAAMQITDLDGVVVMAGYYDPMPAMEWNTERVVKMCDTNLTGAARALGVAMPLLLAKGRGHIVLIGSLAGHRGLPGSIGYGASKAGLMHLAECLRLDLDPGSFKVQVINPGFIDTQLTQKNDFKMPFLMTPEDAAARTRRAMEGSRFETNYPLRFAFLFRVLGWLPNWIYFPVTKRLMGSH